MSYSSPGSAPHIHSRGLRVVADAAVSNVMRFTPPEYARKSYRVLLAHDLTGASEIALVRAVRLTLEREGHLTILHVVSSALPAPAIDAQRAHIKNHLETEVRRWLGSRKLSYRIDIGIGDPVGATAARAQARDVDLVVTGRHQPRALAQMFTTATVGRLLRQMRRPILVVGNSNQSPYRRVLIPIDLTSASAASIQFAADFLPQASLHLLHAYKRRLQDAVPLSLTFSREAAQGRSSRPVERQLNQALSRFVDALRLGERRPIVTIENGDARALINEELARQKTDLLVLGASARSGLEHVPIGNAVDAILRSSPCDMLFLSRHRQAS